MQKQMSNNVVEFPGEYLIEQCKQDRWLTMTSCSIVMGSDEPMAYVKMIVDKFGGAPDRQPNQTNIIAHARFAAKPLQEALIRANGLQDETMAENVFNEWIDAWLVPAPAC